MPLSSAVSIEPLEKRLMFSTHVLYVPKPAHVVIVVEENQDAGTIYGNSQLPFLNSLATHGATFNNSFSETHGSLSDYLALFSGSTQGATDSTPLQSYTRHNLGEELIAKGLSYATYAEGLPYTGYIGGDTGHYFTLHDPAIFFSNVPASTHRTFDDFPSTSGGFANLPTVSLVIPNLDHDMHDGTPQAGDQWAQENLSAYAAWARTHNSLLIVTWDEDDQTPANHIATIFYGQMVRPGVYGEQINHYNVLRTVLDMYHLPRMGNTGLTGAIRDTWLATLAKKAVAGATEI